MAHSVVVTGSSKGLGKSLAQHLNRQGFGLALISTRVDELELVRSQCENPAQVTIHACDLRHPAAVEQAFIDIAREHPSVFGLINNAAVLPPKKPVSELQNQDVEDALQSNLYSALNCIRETLKHRDGQRPLHIVNIGATASLRGNRGTAAFAIAKSALRILTQSLARELGPEKVHAVSVIIDGKINNDRTRRLFPDIPENEFMQMEAIAKAVTHLLLQEDSAWTLELDLRSHLEAF